MSRAVLRSIAVSGFAVGLMVGLAAPASATPPAHETFTESGTEVFAHCDGFDLILAGTANIDVTRFFDESGEVVKVIVRVRGTETYTNSLTGKTVVNRGTFQDFFTRIPGTDEFNHTVSGFDFQAKVDGRGPLVLQDVGRKVYGAIDPETGEPEIVFRAGHVFPEGVFPDEAFCAAVS